MLTEQKAYTSKRPGLQSAEIGLNEGASLRAIYSKIREIKRRSNDLESSLEPTITKAASVTSLPAESEQLVSMYGE